MKFLRFLVGLLLITGLMILGIFISGNQYLLKGVWATYLHGETSATIDDMRFFDTRVVSAGIPYPWKLADTYNQKDLSDTLQRTLEMTETVAFLVVKDDEIVYEKYWDGYGHNSYSNSFSIAKSITAMLVQIAIQKGYIKSWDDKVTDYLPEVQGAYRNELELAHLATMTAGLQWNEHYTNPFDITAKAYYGPDIAELMFNEVPVINPPGRDFEYQSGCSQLLGLVLERATGQTVSEFASSVLWKPLGAASDALWYLDHKGGMELTYCCFNSNARDFARFGALLLHQGTWNGREILDSSFVKMATSAQAVDYYGYSFWIDDDDHLTHIYYLRGILGQYVVVIPQKNLLIVRLGRKRLEATDQHSLDFHVIVREVMKYF